MLGQFTTTSAADTGGTAAFSAFASPLNALDSGLPSGLVDAAASQSASGSLTDITTAIASLAQSYNLTQQQKNFLALNQQLIAQGQAPMSLTQMQGQTASGQIVGGALNLSPTMLLLIGLGVLAVVMSKKR